MSHSQFSVLVLQVMKLGHERLTRINASYINVQEMKAPDTVTDALGGKKTCFQWIMHIVVQFAGS